MRRSDSSGPAGRARNRRGEGSRLREDILGAAAAILEETHDPSAITLRAVARRVGIAAPSIYAHFADREAVLDRLVADGFAQFTAALQDAVVSITDPVERLYALGHAYLAYAAEHPEQYRLLFQYPELRASQHKVSSLAWDQGLASLNVLVEAIADCAAAGRSASTDHFADAVATWAAMHGLAMLRADTPDGFPWPDQEALFRSLTDRLVQLS